VDDSYREIRCGLCGTIFYLCRRCDRGQMYCRAWCRHEARRRSIRAAGARHQTSPEGRLDHRDRQRAYRARLKSLSLRVTHQGSRHASSSLKVPAETEPRVPMVSQGGKFDGVVSCAACGAPGCFVRFATLAWLRDRQSFRPRVPEVR
jgi:hypothetical protein